MADVLPIDIAVRLAAEGVPVRAIARAINVSSAQLWQELNQARLSGRMREVPREEWPTPVSTPQILDPSWLKRIDECSLLNAIMRAFRLTQSQARLMLIFIRSSEFVEHDRLHELYGEGVTRANIKVQICKLRQQIEPLGLEVKTHWGHGYGMTQDHRSRALGLLFGELSTK